jgi:glutamate 5-kinase
MPGVSARPIVLKFGSSTLVDAQGRLRRRRLYRIADEIAEQFSHTPVCIVSSGAIALGLGHLERTQRTGKVPELQAAAAVGQTLLQQAWQRALGRHDLQAGQVLLTAGDFERRESYLNARATIETLLGWGMIPIVNENDSTATQEITFGDNDALAAQVAVLIGARLLILLTDQEGLYTHDPTHPDAALVREVPDRSALEGISTERPGSGWGSGGMRSKVVAAEMARSGGVHCVIANGARSGAIGAAIAGDTVGTRFPARDRVAPAFKLWLRYGTLTAGRITIDAGAARALTRDGASLLPVGVTEVQGRFAAGDGVEIVGPDGTTVAKGLAEMAHTELRRLAGQRGADPAVHRNRLVLIDDA